MPLYYRCKSCGDEHLSPIVFPDRRSYTRSHLTRNLFVCPGTKGAARYGKPDLYWRTDLPTQPARSGPGSLLSASAEADGRIRFSFSNGREHEGRLRCRRKHGDVYLDNHLMARIRRPAGVA